MRRRRFLKNDGCKDVVGANLSYLEQLVPRPGSYSGQAMPVTAEQVCELARTLPRSSEAFVRGLVKFRIGSIVYLSLSADGSTMGFGFPKEWRQVQVEAEPDKFSLPSGSDLRFHWLHVRLAAIDADEMRELVEGAWAMCVPKYVAAEYAAARRWSELAAERKDTT